MNHILKTCTAGQASTAGFPYMQTQLRHCVQSGSSIQRLHKHLDVRLPHCHIRHEGSGRAPLTLQGRQSNHLIMNGNGVLRPGLCSPGTRVGYATQAALRCWCFRSARRPEMSGEQVSQAHLPRVYHAAAQVKSRQHSFRGRMHV